MAGNDKMTFKAIGKYRYDLEKNVSKHLKSCKNLKNPVFVEADPSSLALKLFQCFIADTNFTVTNAPQCNFTAIRS